MLVIRNDQFAALQEPRLQQFETNMLQHLQRFFPVDCTLLGEAQLRAVIREGIGIADSYGFDEQGQVCRYIDLMLSLGSDFVRDPQLPWAAASIAEGNGEPGTFELLHGEALSHIEIVSGAEGHYAMRAILKAKALTFDLAADGQADHAESTLRLLRRLWPQKFDRLRDADRNRFLQLADRLARADGFDAPGPRQLYTIMMFLLGSYFTTDPVMPWAGAAIASADADDPLVRAGALYDAGITAIDRLIALLPQQAGA